MTQAKSILTRHQIARRLRKQYPLFLMLLLPIAFYIIFCYIPMFGLQMAFRDFKPRKGIWGSDWQGLKYFVQFFNNQLCGTIILNTLKISVFVLVAGFLPPIILAVSTNELKSASTRQFVRMLTYLPNFMSTVVVIGIFKMLFKEPTALMPVGGPINQVISALGGKPVEFLLEPEWFAPVYVFSHIWQYMGFASIIYMATISGIDQQLYEAATVDGATRLQRLWHITLPSLVPVAVIIFIMDAGKVLSVGYERVWLLQNSLNLSSSQVISTYVYSMGLQQGKYGYATAVDFFNGIVNLIMICSVNWIARRVSDYSLW